MKYPFPTIIVLLVAFLLVAEQQPRQQTNGPGEAAGQDAPALEEKMNSGNTAKQHPEPSGRSDWPRPFVPTEKINADSVVSFPADI